MPYFSDQAHQLGSLFMEFRLMASKQVSQNASASHKQWKRPELTRVGTMADVAVQKNANTIQGNFT